MKWPVFSLLMCSLVLSLFSCSDEADDPGTEPISALTMSVDGQPWAASDDGPYSEVAVIANFNTTSNLIIEAFAENGSFLSLNLSVVGGIKTDTTYLATDNGVIFQVQYKPELMGNTLFTNLTNMSGQIQFESVLPGEIKGDFEVVITSGQGNELTLSNGHFEISG